MRESYAQALARLLTHEGGYTNHPDDPGGPTNFGITIHDYRKYLDGAGTAKDVRTMRLDDAKSIYKAKYWDALRCDELPAGIDYAVFDYGVNSGTARAAKVLQRVLAVRDDGVIGPETLSSARRGSVKSIVAALCNERLTFLRSLRTWSVFGKGWSRRVDEVKQASLAMVKDEAA